MADTIKKETFTVTLTYEMTVNIDTGEILETKLIDRSINNSDIKPAKPSKKVIQDDGNTEPKLYLEENKCRLNNAAVNLMNLNPDSRLVIRYEQGKNQDYPVIGINEVFGVASGNKITKSNTIACRGNNHTELAKYGTEFVLVPHPNKPGIFILTYDKAVELKGDENIQIDEELDNIDFGLEDLVDNEDEVTEIDSNFFKL